MERGLSHCSPLSDSSRRRKVILIGLLALSAALRAWRLDQGLWYDEIYSLLNSSALPGIRWSP